MFTELINKIMVYEAEGVGKAKTQRLSLLQLYQTESILPTPRKNLPDKGEQEEQEEKRSD